MFLPSEMRTGKVRELMKNYVSLCVPPEEMKLAKSAKNQLGAAAYLAEHGETGERIFERPVPWQRPGAGREGVCENGEKAAASRPVRGAGGERGFARAHP